MIRSTARQFLSSHRRWSTSFGKSIGNAASSKIEMSNSNTFLSSQRLMSSSLPSDGQSSSNSDPFRSAEETFTSLPSFGSSPISPEKEAADSSISAAAEQIASFEPTWWPSDQILVLLNWVNETSGLPSYAFTIGATTLAFRIVLFPIFLKGQKNASRMAHMQPELKVLKDNLDKMGDKIDQESQLKYARHTKALFRKYDCNPLMSIAAPLASAPVFMSMFFGLKNAPDYFPDLLATGGIAWFPDLTVADPYCVLPVLSAVTFLGMIETGKEQMTATDPAKGKIMVNAFRAMAVVMVPMTMNFNAAVFCYWTTNNAFSFMQSLIFKQPSFKKYCGIWDPPKPVPGEETKGILEQIKSMTQQKKKKEPNAWAEDRVKAHNEIIAQQKLVKKRLMEKEGLDAKGRRNN